MTSLAEKIYNAVLDLPTDERLYLMDKLLQIIPAPTPSGIEKSWREESHKCITHILSGKTLTVHGETVFQEIRERFQK